MLQIGQMVFDPFVAVGGYVTDVLLTIQIDAKVSSTTCISTSHS
jgi:hypothetical protein